MPNIGPLELIAVLIVALLVLGPKRLPEMGHSLGKGLPRVQGLDQRQVAGRQASRRVAALRLRSPQAS
jgi:TatA/E family protein of Tat protein translocase